jgi:WD40 repeat protein
LPPLAANRVGLPRKVDEVIARATAKDAFERYIDVESLLIDLRHALSGSKNGKSGAVSEPSLPQPESRPLTAADNPYKGLRAFGEGDTQDFFGREALTHQLLLRLGEGGDLSRLLAVVGPSGSGKSSVVKAGLIPALRRGGLPGSDNWFIVEMIPGAFPLEELESALLRVAVNPPESLINQLREDKRGLLRATLRCLPYDPNIELVLVIDQFEEIFTLVQGEATRAHFLDLLITAALDERSRIRIILTLRADFIDRPLNYVDFGEVLRQRLEMVLPLTPDELEQAIVKPAERIDLKIEPGLVSLILRDVGDQPSTLPLLEYALTEIFEKRADRLLTKSAYQAIGGVSGALGRKAEEVYASLDKAGRAVTRQLYLRLVTLGEGIEDTRRRVLKSEVESLVDTANIQKQTINHVIENFARSRLLSLDRDPGTRGPTIEVAHEALIREWPRLREWLAESRADVRLQRQLAQAANEWQAAKQDISFLLTGARLHQFETWAANISIALTQTEREFLTASIREREKDQANETARQQRELEAARKLAQTEREAATRLRTRNRVIAAAGGLALVLAVLAGLFGLQSSQNATKAEQNLSAAQVANTQSAENAATAQSASLLAQANADAAQAETNNRATAEANALKESQNAQRESLIASVRELAASSINNLSVDPERSILLALQAVNISLQNDQPVLVEAQDALHRSIQTSRLLATLHVSNVQVDGIAYNHAGTRFTSISDDGTLKIWDVSTDKELFTLQAGFPNINVPRKISFSPDDTRLATPAGEHSAKIWDVASGQALLTLVGHTDEVTSVTFSSDGKRIATSSGDGTSKIWDAATGKELLTLTGQNEWLNDVAFSPDGLYLATGGEDRTAMIWDATTGGALYTLPSATGVTSVAFSPDGKTLATGGYDTTWKLWDVSTGQKIFSAYGHTSNLIDISFDPSGTRVATANEDGTTKIWDAATGRELLTLAGHTSGVLGLGFNADGTHLATTSRDGTVKIWDVSPTAGSDWLNLVGHTDRVWSVAYRPDGQQLATLSFDDTVKIWDAVHGQELRTIKLPSALDTGIIGGVSYSLDSKRLVVSDGKAVRIVDSESGAEILTLPLLKSGTVDVVFSHDGTQLAVASQDGTIGLYDSRTGKVLIQFLSSSAGIQRIAFSPDGKRIAVAAGDGITVWDAIKGKQLLTYNGHGEGVRSSGIAFSPDGKWIASSGNDATIRVWDSETGAEIFKLLGHIGATFSVAFSPDGQYLATSSVDRTVKVWKLPKAGEQVPEPLTLYGNTGAVYQVAFSPDGTHLVAVGRNSIVRVYDLNITELIDIAKSRLTRTLTIEECQKYLHVETCP